MKPTYINAIEFMDMLKANSLIIVSAAEFELNAVLKRKRLLSKKAVSLAEILDGKFFPVKTTKVFIDWTISGKIKADEFYQEQTGRKRLMILTAALKRLGCTEN